MMGDKLTTFSRNFEFHNEIFRVIALNIRKYRLLAGITQEQLAVDIGVSYDYIRRFESKRGEHGLTVPNLYKISVVLGVSMDQLFDFSVLEEEQEVTV